MPTAPTGLRERKKNATRDRLLAEARDLLEAMPPSKFTLAEIASNAGISPRSLFRYFDSKTQILLDVCRVTPLAKPGPPEGDPKQWGPPSGEACALSARCHADMGDEWVGAVVARLAGGDLPALPIAARYALDILEHGQAEVLAHMLAGAR